MKKLVKFFLFSFYKLCVKVNFYFGVALILSILTKPLNKKNKHRVLSLNKPVFSNDLEEIKKQDSNIQFLSFPRLLLSEVIKKHVTNFEDLNDATYHPIMNGTKEQEKVYNFIKIVFSHLQWMLKFDAIFAGNYVYVSQQEFFRVAKEKNVPVVVLYKEGMFPSPISEKKSKKLYNGKKFIGSRLLVYNNIIKEILLKAKIPGILDENIQTVGIPRMDSYLKNIDTKTNDNTITLFAFEPEIKASTVLESNSSLLEFKERCEKFQSDLFFFCKTHTKFKLTIKVKTSKDAINDILNILKIKSIDEVPSNIKISTTMSPKKLIMESEFVAGFLSTTLLEAMLLNKYIITPNFEDLNKGAVIDYFTNFKDAVNYANGSVDLERLLLKKIKAVKANKEQRDKVLSRMFYSIDGESSKRVINEINSEIEMHKNTF